MDNLRVVDLSIEIIQEKLFLKEMYGRVRGLRKKMGEKVKDRGGRCLNI